MLIAVVGLVLVGITLGVASRRAAKNGQQLEREGLSSFVYYLLVDWWIDWI